MRAGESPGVSPTPSLRAPPIAPPLEEHELGPRHELERRDEQYPHADGRLPWLPEVVVEDPVEVGGHREGPEEADGDRTLVEEREEEHVGELDQVGPEDVLGLVLALETPSLGGEERMGKVL